MHSTPEESPHHGSGYLKKLLAERNQHIDRAPAIDEEIRRVFERRVAVLVLDMCGFSRLTVKYGIIHFLAMIEQMHRGAIPAVTGNGGEVIKLEADNIFAIFPEPAQALEAAIDIFRSFEAINSVLPEERDLRGSVGIGFGDTLVIGDRDLFGCEMNLASKLGEDLAGEAEILLTADAFQALPAGQYEFEQVAFTISGVDLVSHRFIRSLKPQIAALVPDP